MIYFMGDGEDPNTKRRRRRRRKKEENHLYDPIHLSFSFFSFFLAVSVLFLHLYSTQDLMHLQSSHSLMMHNPSNKSLASTSSANHDEPTISHDDEDQINSTAQHKKTTHSGTKNTTKSVPFFKLFSFADKFDLFLMLSGAVGAAVNGLTIPLMTLLFGQLIDAFGQNAFTTDQVQREVSKVFPSFNCYVILTYYSNSVPL
mgnify:CR=1 FL=1